MTNLNQYDYLAQFKCKACDRLFTSVSSLQRHTKIYNEIHFVYPCCDEKFVWNEHELHDCKGKSYEDINYASECNDVNEMTSDTYFSVKAGNTNKTFRCNNCPATFSRYQSVHNHIIKYPKNHDFICSKCQKHFLFESALKKHLCFLTDGKFMCSCQNEFKNLWDFKQHVGQHRPYFCCLCKKKNVTFNNFINHIRSHTKENPYKCGKCEKTFRVRESLTIHLKLHDGERPFHCSKCNYTSTTKWNLNLHEKRHNPNREKNRKFLCAYCGCRFLLKHHLRRHINTHNEDKVHLCRVCGKLFTQSSYLDKHLDNHKRDSDIGQKCVVCTKDLHKGELYKHHTETGHFRFVCDPCEKVFLTKYNLQRHQKAHKNDT